MSEILKIEENQEQFIVLSGEKEVHVADGVSVKIVDMDSGYGECTFNFGRDVKVELLKITSPGDGANQDMITLNVGAGAEVETTAIYLGNKNSEVRINGHVQDSHARNDINVLYFADQPEKFYLQVRNDFYKKGSCGAITVRGVAANKAHVEVFGEIGIAQKAGGTDSRLDQHALIWGKGSKVRQLPILEINTNDVKAGHGATVSRIQDEELFYFLSRGIPKEVAYNLAVNGFLSVLLTQVEGFAEYHEQVLAAISERTHRLVGVVD